MILESTLSIEAALEELSTWEAELARRSLLTFTKFTHPDYDVNWHHQRVAAALDRVLTGQSRRLMVFMPPQNGKSELVSRRFPAFALGRNPNLRIIACSYSDSLAQDMSRDVQKIMSTDVYAQVFPRVRLGDARDYEKRTQGQFDVVGGRGYYIGAGIMGSITGKTADIGLIDDPIKNRAEAESETYRGRVWEQYKSAFSTRQFGTEGAIVLCMTRWHQDDLAGRLLALALENADADQWDVISLPAIAEIDDDDRLMGEALWPSKYPLAELRRRRVGQGEYDWNALFQQRPTPPGGGMFKRHWFEILEAMPAEITTRCRFWDCAGSSGKGDYTVGTKVSKTKSGIFIIENVVRGQWTAHEVDSIMLQTAASDGYACRIREEQEPGSSGKSVVASHTRMLAGFDYRGVPATGEKTTRWRPFAAQAEAGNVKLLKGAWNGDWLTELSSVPMSAHDDQADSACGAFNELAGRPMMKVIRLEGF